ncbi:MAG TPA: response regulator [Propionibacteriaceae bacterium]|nr:response regulator [Propionibacteriaceae bacterium]
MSAPSPARNSLGSVLRPGKGLTLTAAISLTMIVVVILYLATQPPESDASQTLADIAILASSIFATVACARAARRHDATARGWALMFAATLIWSLGELIYTYYGVTRDHVYPFPSAADAAYLTYAVLALAALFAFPRPPALLISRVRVVLDALVIGAGIVIITEASVLHPLHEVLGSGPIDRLTGLAYPLLEITIAAVVLGLGMEQPSGRRLYWLVLGAGLMTLGLTDGIYIRLLAEDRAAISGAPLTAGWMFAFVLIGLATLVPTTATTDRAGRGLAFGVQLIPYVPVVGALIVLTFSDVTHDKFVVAMVTLLLILISIRQVMIVYENVSLTSDLEARVAERTVELNTLGSIVTSSGDAIAGVSLDGVIIAWNPAAETLYGYHAEEVLGRIPDFLGAEALQGMGELLTQARAGQELSGFEVPFLRKDGSTVPVAMTVSPILDGKVVTGISVFGRDVTQQRDAAAALEQARQEALESSRLKSEFLATMSHEIRTPMNGVIGLTSLLLETELDDIQLQYAEGVRSAGEALLNVINDILDFSKLEAGKIVLDPTDFDPRRLVEDVGALLAPAAFDKHVELIAYCVPEVPETVRGDSGRIRQILLNLASNAVKFTPEGEVVIKVRPVPGGGDGEVRLRFEVRDTGIGLAEADRDRLFESFSQADASTTRRFGGTGLGLAISRHLVEVMGGEIGVASELGAGSTFWFEIPLPVGNLLTSGMESVSHDLLTELRVLVVDDNATNRTILQAQLNSWRMDADLVDSAESALSRLREMADKDQPYDLAILDMHMPEVDGIELARTISADPALRHLPMIVLTSDLQIDPLSLLEAGVGQWLTKPIRSSELYDRLMRLMSPVGAAQRPSGHGQPQRPTQTVPKGKILVVEDNALNQLVAEGVVSRLGYEVHSVPNGAEALEAVESNDYSAVLMDCHMPVMDGFTATREIRQRENGRRTPIIAMTAGALSEDRQRCLEAGMDDYISKPVDLGALEKALARWVTEAVDSSSNSETDPVSDDRSAPETAGHRDPPIDVSRLAHLKRLEGPDGSSLLPLVIDSFVGRSADLLEAASRAVDTGDADLLRSTAHELKGASANIGAKHVATVCGELEVAAGLEGLGRAAEICSRLDAELHRAHAALQRYAGAST